MNIQDLVTGSTLVTFGISHIQMEGLAPNHRLGRNVLSGSQDWEHKVFHLLPSPHKTTIAHIYQGWIIFQAHYIYCVI